MDAIQQWRQNTGTHDSQIIEKKIENLQVLKQVLEINAWEANFGSVIDHSINSKLEILQTSPLLSIN